MMTPNQKKLGLLIGLLIVLGLTLFIGYRLSRGPNPVVVQAHGQKAASAASPQGDARIRLDLLDRTKVAGDLGKSNLFQYRLGKPVEASAHPPQPAAVQQLPTNFAPPPPRAAPPPPLPQIPLKFVGIASIEPNSKALIATLLDDTQHPVNLMEGDIWMGRYRVVKVTETAVDVEDMQSNRRQTLPLVK